MVLFKKKSKYQKIELHRHANGLLLKLNGSPQVYSKEEKLYHECVATLPMMLAASVKRVLVLGGGDGLAARNVLQFSEPHAITMVELDLAVIQICTQREELKLLNNDSLRNPRLELIVGDAIEWLLNSKEQFDVVISDIELEHTDQPKTTTLDLLYRFYRAIGEKLKPGGIWTTTVANDDNSVVLDGLFQIGKETVSKEKQRLYAQQTNAIDKSRILLRGMFPWVGEWNIDFPVLGLHTTFFMSNSKPAGVLRSPQTVVSHINDKVVQQILATDHRRQKVKSTS